MFTSSWGSKLLWSHKAAVHDVWHVLYNHPSCLLSITMICMMQMTKKCLISRSFYHFLNPCIMARILFQDSSFPQRESTSTKGSEKDSWTKAQTSTIKSLTKDCSGMTLVAAMVQHVVFKDTPGCQKLHLTSFFCSFDVTLKWMLAEQDVVEA